MCRFLNPESLLKTRHVIVAVLITKMFFLKYRALHIRKPREKIDIHVHGIHEIMYANFQKKIRSKLRAFQTPRGEPVFDRFSLGDLKAGNTI